MKKILSKIWLDLLGNDFTNFGFSIGGPTDELHSFTKSSETGLG